MTHLRRWGVSWAALVAALVLVGNAMWIRLGVVRHVDEIAQVHGEFVWSQRLATDDPEAQFEQLWPHGLLGISRVSPEGTTIAGRMSSQGANDDPPWPRPPRSRPVRVVPRPVANGGGPQIGAHRVGRGRHQMTFEDGNTKWVLEYAPLLAFDFLRRSTVGVVLSIVAGFLLVLVVTLWNGHRNRVEALAQEAERTKHLAQLGTLSAVIAHELRNPLAILLGHVQLLREDLPDNSSLGHVEDGATRLSDLLDSLLRFARTGEITRMDVDPVELLAAAAVEAGASDVQLEGTAPLWPLDALGIRQVLTNLLTNACQSSDTVTASVRVEGDELVYEVRDEGEGIPEGMHEQIFEPFHTTRLHGTGLGLSVARAMIMKHGGTLTAHDSPGGGACFVARIPR